MDLNGRRTSGNVDDRRGQRISGKAVGGLGLGGMVIVGIITLLLGGNPADVISAVNSLSGGTEYVTTQVETTPEEDELAVFASRILAGTEDVWTKVFAQNGLQYVPPKMAQERSQLR